MSLKSLQLREPRNEKTLRRKDERNKKIIRKALEQSWGQPDFLETHPVLPLEVSWTTACPATSLGIPPRARPSPCLHGRQHPPHQPQLVLLTPALQSRPAHLPTTCPPKTWLNTSRCLPRFREKLKMFEHHKLGQRPIT